MSTIDPELKYCPSCKDEYRAEFSICVACKRDLVSGVELLAGDAGCGQRVTEVFEITEADTLVVLQKGSLSNMKDLKRLLEMASIPAVLSKDGNDCGKGCCGPDIYLQVRSEDGDRAVELIREDLEKSTGLERSDLAIAAIDDAVFDPGATMTICPACGCEFIPISSVCPDCGLNF